MSFQLNGSGCGFLNSVTSIVGGHVTVPAMIPSCSEETIRSFRRER